MIQISHCRCRVCNWPMRDDPSTIPISNDDMSGALFGLQVGRTRFVILGLASCGEQCGAPQLHVVSKRVGACPTSIWSVE